MSDEETPDTESFEATLSDDFESEFEADPETAAEAAAKAAAFTVDYDEDLTAPAVVDAVAESPYDTFQHDFDTAIGDLAAANEDCTDSREYRLAGFGDLAADPTQGA